MKKNLDGMPGWMVAWMVFCALLMIGVIVTAVHFIAKYW